MCFTANDPFGGGSARLPHPHTIFRWRFHNDTEPSKSGYYYVYCEDIKDVLPQAKRLAELEKDEHGKALQREVFDKTNPVYVSLVQTCADLLDERDWQYLDLLIYYYETRRADSLKEALQLVDREKQTEMIASAVKAASSEICSSIHNAAQVMSVTIAECCKLICDNMNANTAALLNASALQNSLLKEAARSSARLAEDVAYIRNHGIKTKNN